MKKCKVVCLVTMLCVLFALFGGISANAYMYTELGSMTLLNQECLDASLMYQGDMTRIANVMRKAERGEDITIAFIGGSITFGSGMSDNDGTAMDRFSEHVQAWFREKYPDTVCRLVNAGLPATGSMIGTFRADKDVIEHKPDLLVIEYAVNEGTSYGTNETSEALIRKMFALDNDPAVMFLFMATKGGSGWGDPAGKYELAQYYGVPCISWRNGVNKAFDLGLATSDDFDADGTHPNKNGHAAVSKFIIHYLEKVYAQLDSVPTEAGEVPAAKYTDDFTYTKHLTSTAFAPSELGSFAVSGSACMYSQFKDGWVSSEAGEPLVFECEAKRLYIPYQARTDSTGVALVRVNGVPCAYLNAKSDDYARLQSALVFQADTTKKLKVEIEHVSGTPFELSGIWLAY